MSGATTPPLTRPVQMPAAVHPEMAVHGQAARQPHQQVLAASNDLEHRPAAEVGGRECGHPEVGPGQLLPGERLIEALTGPPDGVTLRHGAEVPEEWRGSRPSPT